MTGMGSCDAFFEHSLNLADGEIKVYRCEQGWFVKSTYREARSRYLDKALEEVLGKLDRNALRAVVDLLDRELTIERTRTGRSASRSFGTTPHAA